MPDKPGADTLDYFEKTVAEERLSRFDPAKMKLDIS
jgi:hypothetical protein